MSTAPVSKIDAESVDTASPAFDLLAVPPTSTSVRRGEDEIINPTGGLSQEGEIQFDVFSNNGIYTDLKNSYLELDVKVVKKDGRRLPDCTPRSGRKRVARPCDNASDTSFVQQGQDGTCRSLPSDAQSLPPKDASSYGTGRAIRTALAS